MLEVDHDRRRYIMRHSSGSRLGCYATILGMLLVFFYLFFVHFCASDKGTFVRHERSGRDGSDYSTLVSDHGHLHKMWGMDPKLGIQPGQFLLKVPGEFHFRVDPDRGGLRGNAVWFEFGYEGLFWLFVWLGVLWKLWAFAAREVFQRVVLEDGTRAITIEAFAPPMSYRVIQTLPVSDIGDVVIRTRLDHQTTGFDVTLIGTRSGLCTGKKIADLVVATLETSLMAKRLLTILSTWIENERHGRKHIWDLPGDAPATADVIIRSVPPLRLGTNVCCQVCGKSEPDAWIRCADCETPHHVDCWRYMGHCSTYACGSRRSHSERPQLNMS